MHTELKQYTVAELCDGFVYNELDEKGLYGLSGRLLYSFSLFSVSPYDCFLGEMNCSNCSCSAGRFQSR